MYTPTEYAQVIESNKADLVKISNAQFAVLDYLNEQKTYNGLVTALGVCSSVLGIIFTRNTAASVALGVSSLLTGLTPTELQTLKTVVSNGALGLSRASLYLDNHPKYDKIKIRFPFLKYFDNVNQEYMTLVQGEGIITAVRNINPPGWIEI